MSTELGKLQPNVCHSRMVSENASYRAPLAFRNEPSSKFVPFFSARLDEKLDRRAFYLIFYQFSITISKFESTSALHVLYTRVESWYNPLSWRNDLESWSWITISKCRVCSFTVSISQWSSTAWFNGRSYYTIFCLINSFSKKLHFIGI